MENNRNYRVRTSIDDKELNVPLDQDIDYLEVLSLKLRTKDLYRRHNSSYGVLMGRVLANDAFGIPNAKVSVFIPLDDNDALRTEITKLYPYSSVVDTDGNGVRYNLLTEYSDAACHQDVGTFPTKRKVLDNDSVLYVYDKYCKFMTTTNEAGDYMIYGVPIGLQQVHVDLDLSDIGVLSQTPRDMMYKGYNKNEFESPSQFKHSTNLGSLPQIISQDKGVQIYPFFGDSTQNEIAISRCDVHITYKFEPTCIFMGSVVTDSPKNMMSNRCRPNRSAGYQRNLSTGSGTIEMIRKTPGGYVEEYQIQGNQLINGDGVWCYQIPMNLDYVGTDEYGNIVPTDNPSTGIPTRTRARFRVSVTENGGEVSTKHKAKSLVPHILDFKVNKNNRRPSDVHEADLEESFRFGSATPDSQFRDLYWNKVYTVKSYVPRVQTSTSATYDKFIGLKKTNEDTGTNPLPYNNVRGRTPFTYILLCVILTIVIDFITEINSKLIFPINQIISVLNKVFNLSYISCMQMSMLNDDKYVYAPGCLGKGFTKLQNESKGKVVKRNKKQVYDAMQNGLAEDYDVINLDFSNDWLNGCIYQPAFHYKGTQKWKIFGIPFTHTSKKRFCSCDTYLDRVKLYESCSLSYKKSDITSLGKSNSYDHASDYINLKTGVIKEFVNRDDLKIYYYTPGIIREGSYYVLYSTDIVLLGALNECDMDGIPQFFKYLPPTTANVPEISPGFDDSDEVLEVPGMDWGSGAGNGSGGLGTVLLPNHGRMDNGSGTGSNQNGFFTNIECGTVHTMAKSCVNAERLCELGVSQETIMEETVVDENDSPIDLVINATGTITSKDIFGHEARAMFATMNQNKLNGTEIDKRFGGYKKYKFDYLYPNGFNGALKDTIKKYGYTQANDLKDDDYLKFRFGSEVYPFYKDENGWYKFPLYNNSFYFYFGLNNGKTAIDVFNEEYFGDCSKKDVHPYEIKVTSHPYSECPNDGVNALGWIDVDCSEIQKPFYCQISKGKDIWEFIDSYEPSVKVTFDYAVGNGVFDIKMVDANGIAEKTRITVENQKLELDLKVKSLGFNYKGDESANDVKEEEKGSLVTEKIIVYGDECNFTVTRIDRNKTTVEYILKTEPDGYIIKTTFETNDENFADCDETTLLGKQIKMSFVKPMTMKIFLVRMCKEDESAYKSELGATINNGKDMVAFVNDMPYEFINADSDIQDFEKIDLGRLLNPSRAEGAYYKFPTSADDDAWETYIEFGQDSDRNNEIVEYKISTMCRMAESIFDSESGNYPNMMVLGGSDPIVLSAGVDLSTLTSDDEKYDHYYVNKSNYANADESMPLVIDKKVNPLIKGSSKDNGYYYFGAFSMNGTGSKTIPNGISYVQPQLETIELPIHTSILKYHKVPYIDNRITISGTINSSCRYGGLKQINNLQFENVTISNGTPLYYYDKKDSENGNLKYRVAVDSDETKCVEWSYEDADVQHHDSYIGGDGYVRRYYEVNFCDEDLYRLEDGSVLSELKVSSGNTISGAVSSQGFYDKMNNQTSFDFDVTNCSLELNFYEDEDDNNVLRASVEPGVTVSVTLPYNQPSIIMQPKDNCWFTYDKNGLTDQDQNNWCFYFRDSMTPFDKVKKPNVTSGTSSMAFKPQKDTETGASWQYKDGYFAIGNEIVPSTRIDCKVKMEFNIYDFTKSVNYVEIGKQNGNLIFNDRYSILDFRDIVYQYDNNTVTIKNAVKTVFEDSKLASVWLYDNNDKKIVNSVSFTESADGYSIASVNPGYDVVVVSDYGIAYRLKRQNE